MKLRLSPSKMEELLAWLTLSAANLNSSNAVGGVLKLSLNTSASQGFLIFLKKYYKKFSAAEIVGFIKKLHENRGSESLLRFYVCYLYVTRNYPWVSLIQFFLLFNELEPDLAKDELGEEMIQYLLDNLSVQGVIELLSNLESDLAKDHSDGSLQYFFEDIKDQIKGYLESVISEIPVQLLCLLFVKTCIQFEVPIELSPETIFTEDFYDKLTQASIIWSTIVFEMLSTAIGDYIDHQEIDRLCSIILDLSEKRSSWTSSW